MTLTTMTLLVLAAGTMGTSDHDEARAYYPVHMSDTWTYESSERGVFRNQVVDTSRVGDAAVFHVRSTDGSGRTQMFTVRYDGPQVYIAPEQGSEMLLADFGLEAGGSRVDGSRGATVRLKAHHESLDVSGTRFSDVVEVEHSMPSGTTMTYYFARGLGMVGNRSRNPESQVRLVTATVGGLPFNPNENHAALTGFESVCGAVQARESAPIIELRLAHTDSATGRERVEYHEETLYLESKALVTDSDLEDVRVETRPGQLVLDMELGAEGAERLARTTEQNIGSRMGVFVASRLRAAPRIQGDMGRRIQALVDVSEDEMESLVDAIRARWPGTSGPPRFPAEDSPDGSDSWGPDGG